MSLDDLDNGWPTYVCAQCGNGYDSQPHDVLALGPYGSRLPFCSESCTTAWMNGQWDGQPAAQADIEECEHTHFAHDADVTCAEALSDYSDGLSADIARSVQETNR